MLPPDITARFASDHDLAVATTLTRLLDTAPLPAEALAIAHLPLHMGGLGLTSASSTAIPAHWASWADTLLVIHNQAPNPANTIQQQLNNPEEATPAVQAAIHSADHLRHTEWEPPAWQALTNGQTQPEQTQTEGPSTGRGWQQPTSHACHAAHRNEVIEAISPASQALLDSQSGPHASRPFTTIPYNANTTYPSHLFCLLLLRRLRLPLPLSARQCRCRRALDPLGDHRAACPQAGILRSRGVPLERAAATICREAGARVTTNTKVADLNLQHLHRHDDRRIEVIANGRHL